MITAKEALEIYSENLPNEISKTLELCNNHIVRWIANRVTLDAVTRIVN